MFVRVGEQEHAELVRAAEAARLSVAGYVAMAALAAARGTTAGDRGRAV